MSDRILDSLIVFAILMPLHMLHVLGIAASLAYIELGTIIPEQGGEYTYLLRAFGQLVGFLYSWMGSICIRPSSYAILAQAFATYAVEPFYQVDGQIKAGVKDDVELIKTIVTVALLSRATCVKGGPSRIPIVTPSLQSSFA